MTHGASALNQAAPRQAAPSREQAKPAAAAESATAAAGDKTRFPKLFKSLRGDDDARAPEHDAAAPADAATHADGDTQDADADALAGAAMLNLPMLALAAMAPNGGTSAEVAAAAGGAPDGVRAPGNGASASIMSQADALASRAGVAMRPDADPALKSQMARPGLFGANPAMQQLDQAVAQGGAGGMPSAGAAFAAPAGASPMPAPDAARPASVREAETAAGGFRRNDAGGAADFAPISMNMAAASGATQGEPVRLAGAPSQWQQPLREALGERLQVQVGRNSEQAVIRLDPPMLGRIEISIRHEAGALQVHMSASNGEVLRQLNNIGESLRQDLIHRQYADVAVVVSSSSRNSDADNSGRQRHGSPDREEHAPGRALHEADQDASGFAFLTDSE
jgi:type III secretion system needle length determinant